MTCRYLVESAADITYEHDLLSTVAGFAFYSCSFALLGRRSLTRLVKNPPATPRSVRTLIRVIASTRLRLASRVSRPCRY